MVVPRALSLLLCFRVVVGAAPTAQQPGAHRSVSACKAPRQAASASASSTARTRQWRNPKDGMRFVWVPEGSFRLEPGDGQASTTPPQRFSVPTGYWLGRTEVTRAQFARFVKETGYVTEAEKAGNRWTWRDPGYKQRGDHPAVYIGYSDAQRYAQWAGVALPTEAEWLYACLAGSEAIYPWGNKMDDRRAWHRENAGDGTRPVGRKLPNAWGLHGMVGNAQEWCQSGPVGVLRGGSWSRCPGYRYLDGRWMEPFTWELARTLHDGSPVLQYPWDDDRGFRCIRRVGPVAGEVTPPPSASR